jgi:ribosomal protein S2
MKKLIYQFKKDVDSNIKSKRERLIKRLDGVRKLIKKDNTILIFDESFTNTVNELSKIEDLEIKF